MSKELTPKSHAEYGEIISITQRARENAFRDGILKTTGTDIDGILPPMRRFGGGNRAEKKQGIIEKLMSFFEKYLGLG